MKLPRSVLVIDDSLTFREYAKAHGRTAVSDLYEATIVLRDDRFDLILLDVNLRETKSDETHAKILSLAWDTEVQLISASPQGDAVLNKNELEWE